LSERLNIAISDDAPFNITYVKFVFNNTTTNQNNSGFDHDRSTRMSIGPKPRCTITIMAMSTISYLDSEGSDLNIQSITFLNSNINVNGI
jgi:hypothetical protein